MLKEQMPDIIIVDVRLGPSSGMDLIADYGRWITEKRMSSYSPVFIVITAYNDEEAKKRAEEYKVDAFLMKPISKETIVSTVLKGISKILRRELNIVDTIQETQNEIGDKISDADKELGDGR
jgi:YesN/AraC family two-component response regulator